MSQQWSVRFLGVGSSVATELGCSSAVLECEGQARLLIDCGPGTLARFKACYGGLPSAVYLSHLHLDHIGDLEALFYQACFTEPRPRIRVFVAAHLVPWLCQRVANYPGQIAEGGVNFWDVLQLVPVVDGFWFDAHFLKIHATRHHQPQSSFALHWPGRFIYTGDTRPIPEVLHHFCSNGEIIFHDGQGVGNPAHSSVDELLREYRPDILARLYVYHYHSAREALELSQQVQVVHAGQRVALQEPVEPQGCSERSALGVRPG